MDGIVLASLVGPLLGVIVGAGISYLISLRQHEWAQQDRDQERQELRRNVRVLLSTEMERNRKNAEDYFNMIQSPDKERLAIAERVDLIVAKPFPAWGHAMWDGQSQYLALALSPKEMVTSLALRALFDGLIEQRTVIVDVQQKRDAEIAKLNVPMDAAVHGAQVKEIRAQFDREVAVPYKHFRNDLITAYSADISRPIAPDD